LAQESFLWGEAAAMTGGHAPGRRSRSLEFFNSIGRTETFAMFAISYNPTADVLDKLCNYFNYRVE